MRFLSNQGLMLGLLTTGVGYIIGQWWTIIFGVVIFIPSLIVCHYYFEAGVRRQEEIAVGYGCLLQAGLFYGYADLYLVFDRTPEAEKWRLWFWLVCLLLLTSRIMLTLFPDDDTPKKEHLSQKTLDIVKNHNNHQS